MKVKEVIELFDAVLPEALVDDWDNCGLLVGDDEDQVSHIRTALEASDQVIDQAILDGVDLLVVHHPMIFAPMKSITTASLRGGKVIKLIKAGISLYAAHTNLDRCENGLNQRFGKRIGISNFEAIEEEGYVLAGELEQETKLKTFVEHLNALLGVGPLRYVGADDLKVKRVAFCTGSGVGLLQDHLFDQVDVYLSGDLKYHDAMDMYEKNQAFIDVTHFGSEQMAAEVLYDMVTEVVGTVRVTCDSSMTNPIKQ